MSYFKWFLKEGYKSYIVPFILGLFLTLAVINHFREMVDTPIGIQICMYITLAGFDIGMVIHSIMIYKKSK